MESLIKRKSYCRICLVEYTSFKHSLLENNLIYTLMETISVEIKMIDNLSVNICKECFKTIKLIQKFKEKCINSNKTLEDYCKEITVKIEPDSYLNDLDAKNEGFDLSEMKPEDKYFEYDQNSKEENKINEININKQNNKLSIKNESTTSKEKKLKSFYCKYCDMSFSGPSYLYKHKKSSSHIKNVNQISVFENYNDWDIKTQKGSSIDFEEKGGKIRKITAHFQCRTCEVTFFNKPELVKHFTTIWHQEYLQILEKITTPENAYSNNLSLDIIVPENFEMIKKENEKCEDIFNDLFSTFNCQKCNQSFNNLKMLNKHFKTKNHHPDELIINNEFSKENVKIVCKFCENEEFSSLNGLMEHFNIESHINKIVQNNEINRRKKLNLIYQFNSMFVSVCIYCNKTIRGKTNYTNHLKQCSEGPQAMESNEIKTINEEDEEESMYNEMLNHDKIPEYLCKECNYVYYSENFFNKHMELHKTMSKEEIKKLNSFGKKCKFCERYFKRKRALSKHYKYHKGIFKLTIKKVICYVCGAFPQDMKEHLKSHNPNKEKFFCEICEDRPQFKVKKTLEEHIKAKHTRKYDRVACAKCGLVLHYKNLSKHIKYIHTEVELKECSVCKKTFKTASNLKLHMRLHTDERPFSCDMCDKKFRHRSTLKKHYPIHTGERFKCDLCEKSFTQKGCILEHKKKAHFKNFNQNNSLLLM